MKEHYWISERESLDDEKRVILNDFLLSHKLENKSPITIDSYRRALEHYLLDYCPLPLQELTSADVKDGLDQMNLGKEKVTKLFYISILSTFLKFCRTEGIMDKNLIKSRWRPKHAKSLPRILTKSDQAQLKVAAESLSLRYRVIVEFLLSTGCRCNELHRLDVSDLDIQKRTAQILGKGNKVRTVFFSEACAVVLKKYLETHPVDSPALLVNQFGGRVSNNLIRLSIKKCVRQAGLSVSISPHYFRHGFASNLLAKGVELAVIGEALGHKHDKTTEIYTHLLAEQLVSAYRKYKG